MADEEAEEVAAPEPVEEVEMSVLDALKEVRSCRQSRLLCCVAAGCRRSMYLSFLLRTVLTSYTTTRTS